jgi:alginate O-acetyltransferase complex protein AlgJ
MVPRYSRFILLLIFFLLLATPLVTGLVIPENVQEILKEGRTPAPLPSVPHSLDQLAALPNELDDYLHDHFGLRTQLIGWYAYLAKWMLAEGNRQVLVGRHGRMFYLGEDTVRQSAGLVRRESRVAETADFLAVMRDALMERGIRFLVASPPNAPTIYQDDLPRWARSQGRTTEYDLFVADLAARGIKAIDLRPTMWAVRSKSPAYFLYDTHWTSATASASELGR